MSVFALYLLDISKLELSCALQSVRMSLKSSRRWVFWVFFCVFKCDSTWYLRWNLVVVQFYIFPVSIFSSLTSEGESMNWLSWCFQESNWGQEGWDIFEMLLNSLTSQVRRGLLIAVWYSWCKDDSCIGILNFYFTVLILPLTPVKVLDMGFICLTNQISCVCWQCSTEFSVSGSHHALLF